MKRILILLLPLLLFAKPAQVILIRHAEKPTQGQNLDLKGRERAAALVPFFMGAPVVLQYGHPVAIYTPYPDFEETAHRPEQTIRLLAERLKLQIYSQYSNQEISALVKEILSRDEYEGQMVLVCWHHTELPNIAAALGAKKAPLKWDEKVYDRLWILTFEEDEKVRFEDKPQRLLFGDSSS